MREHAALRRVLLLVCTLFAVTAITAAGAQAASGGPVFALQPLGATEHSGYFVLSARPGATVTRAVRVANAGTAAGTVLLYGVDATTGQTTGAVYRDRQDPRRDVGAWTHLQAASVRLAPNQSRIVHFTITVPGSATGGQHLGGIVAEPAHLTRGVSRRHGHSSFRIDIRSLTIVAVQMNLPGTPREAMTLTGVRPGGVGGHQMLLIGMRNDGNQLTRGTGQLQIRDHGGALIRQSRFLVGTFVPHTQIDDPISVPGSGLAAGGYQATVILRYGHGHMTHLSEPFAISRRQVQQVFGSTPQDAPRSQNSGPSVLVLILGGLALVVLAFLAALLVLRRQMRSAQAQPPQRP